MRLDHISYAASHDQLIDVVQRLGSRIGSAFTDGGIHPRFGTRNFTLPLKHGLYLEVVCPLDHPAADASPFGKIVSQRANEGGGWLSWVLATEDISKIESRLSREAVDGHRKRPDGTELKWKQIGVLDTLQDYQKPFFIQWLTKDHPSDDGKATAEIVKLEIVGTESTIKEWVNSDLNSILGNIEIDWVDPAKNQSVTGLVGVYIDTKKEIIKID